MIVSPASLAGLALIALGMVCTPGPNMVYLLSRSILQGRLAGAISLGGVLVGILCYILCTALGLTALMLAVPLAYEAVKWAGALYLLWLAWGAVRPGAGSALEPRRDLKIDRPAKLFGMGFLTALLNPKIAVFYVSLLPQFIDPERGHVLLQGLVLGGMQAAISFTVNLGIVFAAGSIAAWFAARPSWLRAQRWIMGSLLAGFAVRLAFDKRPV
ncbi:threonine/homoserine/homoserine lactone efflux protein [Inquilinus ginsengisoli]|uniref:Threonine/homoserine/homoserine lactone efflux protein n=1 Tax=Inquilinus ginsengisoli TaxID=363840 RepID=A0ABU1JL62_9PROT|nr:LysE family translocator [Inquilinus ginsengisoli]MDR6289348.1 threonine/homoserine/homoserine lactone efflux protein [Inquilinus ginsengisoli]